MQPGCVWDVMHPPPPVMARAPSVASCLIIKLMHAGALHARTYLEHCVDLRLSGGPLHLEHAVLHTCMAHARPITAWRCKHPHGLSSLSHTARIASKHGRASRVASKPQNMAPAPAPCPYVLCKQGVVLYNRCRHRAFANACTRRMPGLGVHARCTGERERLVPHELRVWGGSERAGQRSP